MSGLPERPRRVWRRQASIAAAGAGVVVDSLCNVIERPTITSEKFPRMFIRPLALPLLSLPALGGFHRLADRTDL